MIRDDILILGIDAAWTETEPAGVALVKRKDNLWRCLCVAPSYNSFLACADGRTVDWENDNFRGERPNIGEVIEAAHSIGKTPVDLVAIDMPVATVKFNGRRVADNAISKVFGRYGCSAHSPNKLRPGPLGIYLTKELNKIGYPIATTSDPVGVLGRTIEVYPHPALLTLLGVSYRVPYKVAKSKRYWASANIPERIFSLLEQFGTIEQELSRDFGETGIPLPSADYVKTLSVLKRYEDALDALVSAWVGMQFVCRNASAYGDHTAAVWVPLERKRSCCKAQSR